MTHHEESDCYSVTNPTPTSLRRAPLVFEFHLFLCFAFAHLACAAFLARSLAVGVPAVFGPPIFPPLLPIVLKNSLTALLARAMAAMAYA
jgi:hypothetical protein